MSHASAACTSLSGSCTAVLGFHLLCLRCITHIHSSSPSQGCSSLAILTSLASLFLQVKVEKCGSTMWSEVPELAKLLREGTTKWEDLNLDDVDIRMKFAGLFHRGKRTPQRFMMRLKVRLLRVVWLCCGFTGCREWL